MTFVLTETADKKRLLIVMSSDVILSMPFGLTIGKVLIIISSLGFVIHLFAGKISYTVVVMLRP